MRYLFDDFILDVDKRELRRGPVAVSIAPQAFDLLVYLIRNREQVTTKDDLIAAVWGRQAVTDAALAQLAHDGYDPSFGARPLKRVIQREIGDAAAMLILEGKAVEGDTITVDSVDGRLTVST